MRGPRCGVNGVPTPQELVENDRDLGSAVSDGGDAAGRIPEYLDTLLRRCDLDLFPTDAKIAPYFCIGNLSITACHYKYRVTTDDAAHALSDLAEPAPDRRRSVLARSCGVIEVFDGKTEA